MWEVSIISINVLNFSSMKTSIHNFSRCETILDAMERDQKIVLKPKIPNFLETYIAQFM